MNFLLLRRLLMFGLMGACLASAEEITFSLSTTGSFSSGTPSDLVFHGIGSAPPGGPAGYTGTTTGGSLVLSNLGTFTLYKPAHGADPYNNDTFTLDVLFFLPSGINGSATYSATLSGTVNTQQGSLLIDFGPAQHFTFSNTDGSGSFDLRLNDVSMTLPHTDVAGVTQVLSGAINNATDPPVAGPATAPEPLSIVLLGTVMVFVATLVRRRKSIAS
jgi:hypothetical protein